MTRTLVALTLLFACPLAGCGEESPVDMGTPDAGGPMLDMGAEDAALDAFVDYCAPNPCQNGGVCASAADGYRCTCAFGFSGTDCEVTREDIGAFQELPGDNTRWTSRLNDAAAGFAAGTYFDFTWSQPSGSLPVVGDFDGDGLDDIAVYQESSGNTRWIARTNDGAGSFAAESYFDVRWVLPLDAQPLTGDFDGDGRDDIAAYIELTGSARWVARLNSGSGGFATQSYFDFTWNVPAGSLPVVGDFDGDGRDDIAVHQAVTGGARWIARLNNGSGGFATQSYFDFTWSVPAGTRPLAADWNGDGRDDAAVFQGLSGSSRWIARLNNGSAAFATQSYFDVTWGVPAGTVPLVGDFN